MVGAGPDNGGLVSAGSGVDTSGTRAPVVHEGQLTVFDALGEGDGYSS